MLSLPMNDFIQQISGASHAYLDTICQVGTKRTIAASERGRDDEKDIAGQCAFHRHVAAP